jgi:hypothetical protein
MHGEDFVLLHRGVKKNAFHRLATADRHGRYSSVTALIP